MPVQKWCCTYCTYTFSNEKDAIEHETDCPWNPLNKNCCTCAHLSNHFIYGDNVSCMLAYERHFDVYEGNEKCPLYKEL